MVQERGGDLKKCFLISCAALRGFIFAFTAYETRRGTVLCFYETTAE